MVSRGNKKPLTETVYPVPVFSEEERKQQQAVLTQTENAQPAIGIDVGMYHIFKAGFSANYFAGHLTVNYLLYMLQAIDLATFIKLSKEKAAMSAQAEVDAGTMILLKQM